MDLSLSEVINNALLLGIPKYGVAEYKENIYSAKNRTNRENLLYLMRTHTSPTPLSVTNLRRNIHMSYDKSRIHDVVIRLL